MSPRPPQNPDGVAWHYTQACVMRSQLLTACALEMLFLNWVPKFLSCQM